MGAGRRRSARNASSQQKSPEPSNVSTPSTKLEVPESGPSRSENTCPACEANQADQSDGTDKENWIRCDACKTWFHWHCTGGGDLEVIDKWLVRCHLRNGFTL